MEHHTEALRRYLDLSTTSQIAFIVLFALLMLFFAYTIFYRYQLMMLAKKKDIRWDNIGERFWGMIKYAIGQYRMPQDIPAGILHMAIFYGFLTVSVRTIMLTIVLITGNSQFHLWIFGPDNLFGQLYILGKDIMTVVVAFSALWLAWRRVVTRPKRLEGSKTWEATLILFWIFTLMLTDYLVEASQIALERDHLKFIEGSVWFMPFASMGSYIFSGASASTLAMVWKVSAWIHITLVWTFLNYLPYGKHFHVITAIPNVFFRRLTPPGRLEPMPNLEEELEKEDPRIGLKDIQDMSWKQIFDVYTCTECGRCTVNCPAFDTEKPLSMRDVNNTIKHYLYEKGPYLLGKKTKPNGEDPEFDGPTQLVPEVLKPETIWACTLCRECEDRCPVFIEQVPRIVEARRYLTMMEGDFPQELNNVFKGFERNSNPWNLGFDKRADWITDDLDVKIMSELSDDERKEIEFLFYVGCMGSYDDASIKITKSLVKILNAAGVKFAVLGVEETCCGETARRVGNEFLGQMMIEQLVETLNGYGVKKIVTTCPHGYNTFKNEYPDFGGNYEVWHAHELVAKLISEGKIKLKHSIEGVITYHDSCFLGRYNEVYDAPREIISAIPGLTLKETERNRNMAYCCGAGGGRMWMEEKEPRINYRRFDELASTNANLIGTSCPYCNTMITDGSKARNKEDDIKVKDLLELVAEAMEV